MPAMAARVPLLLLCGRGTVAVMTVIMTVMTMSAAASAVALARVGIAGAVRVVRGVPMARGFVGRVSGTGRFAVRVHARVTERFDRSYNLRGRKLSAIRTKP